MKAANSLAWTLALLVVYSETQDQAYQEIVENWPQPNRSTDDIFQGRFSTLPTIDVYARFTFILACHSDRLRLFLPVQQVPKVAAEGMRIVLEMVNSQDASSNILNVPPSSIVQCLILELAGPDRKEGKCLLR